MDLATVADAVVVARVEALAGAWHAPARAIVTLVDLTVLESLGGPINAETLTLRQLGGRADGLELRLNHQARFDVGEEVLLFLEAESDGALRTVDYARGKWTLSHDAQTGAVLAVPPQELLTASPVSLETARRALETRPIRQRPFLTSPQDVTRTLNNDALIAPAAPSSDLLPTDGYPARWHEADDGVAVAIDAAPLPAGWSGSGATVTAAASLWSGAGSTLKLGTPTTGSNDCPTAFTGSGRITVAFAPANCAPADWVVAGGYYTAGDLRAIGGITFQKFVQGFVIVGESGTHTASSRCLQDAVAHGLGHAVGLGHTSAPGNLMEATPASGCASSSRTLGSDDIATLKSIYADAPAAGRVPAAPSTLTASSTDGVVTMRWTVGTGGGVVQQHIIEAGSGPGLSNLATLTTGASTTYQASNVPAGTYWLRVRARNALGTSTASPETSVVVTPCLAPESPRSFAAASQGTLASLSWLPPAGGGGIAGYRLEVGSALGRSDLLTLSLPATPTTYEASGPSGTYALRLRAVNACGVSAPTPDVLLTLRSCVAPPAAPSDLTATAVQRVVTIAWPPAPTGNSVQQFVVQAGSAPGASDRAVLPVAATTTTYQAAAPPGTYYIRVVSRNACGDSPASPERRIVVQ